MEYSKYQTAIFDEVIDIRSKPRTGRNIMVIADAGTGKTTTIQAMTKLIPEPVLYLAYNSHIAADYRPKALANTDVRTTHAHGYKAILSTIKYGKGIDVVIDQYKTTRLTKNILFTRYLAMGQATIDHLIAAVPQIVSHYKSALLQVTPENTETLSDRYNIDDYFAVVYDDIANHMELEDGTIKFIDAAFVTAICKEVLTTCLMAFIPDSNGMIDNTIDFDDQIWLPVMRNDIRVKQFPWVIVDEGQDLNAAQHKLIMKSVKANGTVIVVGDPNQAIYGFRGADTNSMENMRTALKAKVFSLPICYRCPTSHIELAQGFVSSIQCYPENIKGTTESINSDNFRPHIEEMIRFNKDYNRLNGKTHPVYVLCRTNAPLVKPCFELIKAGINSTIRGADIGKALINLVHDTKGQTIEEFQKNLKTWYDAEYNKRVQKGKSTSFLTDKYETVDQFADACETVPEISRRIQAIFSDQDSAVVFSTVHKAKGFESAVIYRLGPMQMSQEDPAQQTEERNIEYISLTRSKSAMVDVKMCN